jgi:AraC-like DNA-binding protein
MALLGPHLPHTWCAPESSNGISTTVYVAQIPAAWLETLAFGMPDLGAIKSLLERSRRGLKFSEKVVEKSAALFASMVTASPSQRFIYLMKILQLMVEDTEAKVLSSPGYNISMSVDPSIDKLDRVIRYLHKNYTNNLMAADVAKLVHMSTNYFHRFIKQRTEQTFTELVNQLRISKACSLLISSQMPISTISDTCGFNNISNFNRRFLQFKGMKPRDFRKLYAGRHLLT